MRGYLRRKRLSEPVAAMWQRAKSRAKKDGLPFKITPEMIFIPPHCPVLGIPLRVGERRSRNSPSLDRIRPSQGYVPGNIRVVSDLANILKGRANPVQLRLRAVHARPGAQSDYARVADYVEREALLLEVRKRAESDGRHAEEWGKVAVFLESAFSRGEPLA